MLGIFLRSPGNEPTNLRDRRNSRPTVESAKARLKLLPWQSDYPSNGAREMAGSPVSLHGESVWFGQIPYCLRRVSLRESTRPKRSCGSDILTYIAENHFARDAR